MHLGVDIRIWQNLIVSLMTVDPKLRPTADQVGNSSDAKSTLAIT